MSAHRKPLLLLALALPLAVAAVALAQGPRVRRVGVRWRDGVPAVSVSARDLANGLKAIGSRFARAVNRVFRRVGPVLADRAHVHVLRTPREVRHAIAYVLLNARRHAAKLGCLLGGRPVRIDPASSGRWSEAWRTPPTRAPDPPAVAAPRTWLLAVGWRRHGLVDPDEVPGRRA